MKLTWLGTAGFIVDDSKGRIALDPYLSRGTRNGKGLKSPFRPEQIDVQAIFIGHGHFDHVYDVPQIAKQNQCKVFAPEGTGRILKWRGLSADLHYSTEASKILFEPLKVRAFKSNHINFDMPLILNTLKRFSLYDCACLFWLGTSYPKGVVQTYYFEAGGKKFLFASSAGCTKEEWKIYRGLEVDVFLAPLQGHTNIQSLMAEMTTAINPKVVIPHHHDDFYPPLSQEISAEIFREELRRHQYAGDVLEIPIFDSVSL